MGRIQPGHVHAIHEHPACVRRDESHQQFQQAALAAARAADQRDGGTGRDGEIDAVQHFAAVVGQADGLETHIAAYRCRQATFGGGRQRRVDHIHHPVHRGHRALVEIGHVGQPGQRPEQALGQIHQRRIRADAQLAFERFPAAIEQGGDETGQHRHADHWRDGGGEADRLGIAGAIAVGGRAHVFEFSVFRGVGLDRRDAGQVVVEPIRNRRGGLACGGVTRGEFFLEPERTHQDQRDGQEGQCRQIGGEHEEHTAHHQRGHRHLHQIVGAGVEEALDLMHVFVQNRHQSPAACAGPEIRRQRLHMRIGCQPQFVLEVLCQPAPLDRVEILEQRFGQPYHDGDAGEQHQLLQRIGDAHACQKRIALIHHDVHRHADQGFGQHIEHLVQDRIQRRQPGIATIRAGIAEQATQRMARSGSRRSIHPPIVPCRLRLQDAKP